MIQVRGSNYRGKDGFMICGKSDGKHIRIFVKHLSTARAIQAVINNKKMEPNKCSFLVDKLILEEI